MPGEIVFEVLGGALKFIGRVIADVIFEVCVKGLGYLICKPFSRSVDPDGLLVTLVGAFAWILIFFLFSIGYNYISAQAEIDRCLDAGGGYDYQNNICNHLINR